MGARRAVGSRRYTQHYRAAGRVPVPWAGMPVRTALDALTMRPTRFLRSWWPWRSTLYLCAGALPSAPAIALLLVPSDPTLPLSVAAGTVLVIVAGGVGFARLERWRLRLVDRDRLVDPHRPVPRPAWRHWLRVRAREDATWRELGYATITGAVFCWMDAVVVVFAVWFPVTFLFAPIFDADEPLRYLVGLFGVALVAAAPYPVTAWAGARAAMARSILTPRGVDDLGERLVEVTRSRARLVDAFAIERRRIERDLHDGAQQRLVALNMQIGLARLEVPAGSPAGEPLARAHELAKQALTELRELIRGVHPQILTDRGLAAAVKDIADRAPVPVDIDIRLPGRLPETIEVTAYFVVVEALTNVARHSAATRAAVTAWLPDNRLVLRVRDNGAGGADPAAGTGLAGLADRVAAAGGTMALSSPRGGPTVLQAEFAGVSPREPLSR